MLKKVAFGLFGAMLFASPVMAQNKVTIGVSLASDTNPFYIAMKKGIEARAKETGINVVFVTANEVVSQQMNGIQDLIARDVDAIMVSPIDTAAVAGAYEMATKAGIPVISVVRFANNPFEKKAVTYDWKSLGTNIGNWVVDKTGGKGKVAMIAGPAGAQLFRDLATGFREVVSKQSAMPVVYHKEVALTREQGLKQAEDILTAHPDVKVIYAGNDEIALGAAQAVQVAGKTGDIIVTGFNGVPPAVRAVKEGTLSLTYDVNSPRWGAVGLDVAVVYAKGGTVNDSDIKLSAIMIDAKNVDEVLKAPK